MDAIVNVFHDAQHEYHHIIFNRYDKYCQWTWVASLRPCDVYFTSLDQIMACRLFDDKTVCFNEFLFRIQALSFPPKMDSKMSSSKCRRFCSLGLNILKVIRFSLLYVYSFLKHMSIYIYIYISDWGNWEQMATTHKHVYHHIICCVMMLMHERWNTSLQRRTLSHITF